MATLFTCVIAIVGVLFVIALSLGILRLATGLMIGLAPLVAIGVVVHAIWAQPEITGSQIAELVGAAGASAAIAMAYSGALAKGIDELVQ